MGPDIVAFVTLTVTMTVSYTQARCVCGRRVMDVPGKRMLEVRRLKNASERSGRGPSVDCPRCGSLLEVIAHG